MMTRARQRQRLLVESSECMGWRCNLSAPDESADNKEWRDWASLLPELVEDISGRLLSVDVAEYLRFRAVCRPWRGLTADPHAAPLDSRFRPRNWTVLTITPDARPRRHLLNLATAASLSVDLPALSTHCHLCAADGLLVLFHMATKAICLLDPLSNIITEFPSIISIVAAVAPSRPGLISTMFRNSSGVNSHTVNGAGFDDSTTPPTLVLCLRDGMCNIVFAKPGDAHWTLVNEGQASHPMYSRLGRVLFYSLLSLGGHCYVSSPEGYVYLVKLHPLPQLVEMVNQRCFAEPDNIFYQRIISFLVCGIGGRMMMVRYWRGMEHFGGMEGYNRKDLFTVGGITSRIEVLEVDMTAKRMVPVRSLGHGAIFVGLTHCVLISTEMFPSVAVDAIYLGCLHQRNRRFSVYHVNNKRNNRRTEPPHKFTHHEDWGLVPGARPCNLDQYLVCYVDRAPSLGGAY